MKPTVAPGTKKQSQRQQVALKSKTSQDGMLAIPCLCLIFSRATLKVTLADSGDEVSSFSLSHRQVTPRCPAATVKLAATCVVTFPCSVDEPLTGLLSLAAAHVTVGSGVPAEVQVRSSTTVPIDRRSPDE